MTNDFTLNLVPTLLLSHHDHSISAFWNVSLTSVLKLSTQTPTHIHTHTIWINHIYVTLPNSVHSGTRTSAFILPTQCRFVFVDLDIQFGEALICMRIWISNYELIVEHFSSLSFQITQMKLFSPFRHYDSSFPSLLFSFNIGKSKIVCHQRKLTSSLIHDRFCLM